MSNCIRVPILAGSAALVICGWALIAQDVSAVGGAAAAETTKPPSSDPGAGARDVPPPRPIALTEAREAAALTFARMHHPELAGLLEHLKKSRPAAYTRAVRQLYQTSERLARTKERSPERYESALRQWQLESRIRLLAARATMSDNPSIDDELNAALDEWVELRLQQLRAERERLADRLTKLDATIGEIESDKEAVIIQELARVKRSLGIRPGKRDRKAGATGERPAKPRKERNNTTKPSRP